MLRIYLQGYESSDLTELAELCRSCLQLDWDARVHMKAETPSEILSEASGSNASGSSASDSSASGSSAYDLPALFVMEDSKRDELDFAVSGLRALNFLHYLILRLCNKQDAFMVRPAYLPCQRLFAAAGAKACAFNAAYQRI